VQTKKDYTRDDILKAAETIFLRDGFNKANMRDIAKSANVGLSNLYNYFKNKDEILRVIVAPVIQELDRVLLEHHNPDNLDEFELYLENGSELILKGQTGAYLYLTRNYRRQMELLFTKAQGSSLENFIDDYTDRCTVQVDRYMNMVFERHPELRSKCHPFSYHLQMVWMFDLFTEIIKHHIKPKDAERDVTEYIKFVFHGWRGLMVT